MHEWEKFPLLESELVEMTISDATECRQKCLKIFYENNNHFSLCS